MKQNWWNPWRFLAFRLFSGFWLVLILGITCAVLVAQSLEPATEIRRLPPGIHEQLQPIIHSLRRFDSVEELSQRINRRDKNRWLVVDPETNQILNSTILPKNFDQKWLTELSQLNKPRLLMHKNVMLAGPFLIDFHGRPLALYQQRQRNDLPFFNLALLPKFMLPLLLLIFSGLICYGLALTITRPLRQLQQKHLQFASGDLACRISGPDQRNDEIGEVARGFNLMASQIAALLQNNQRLLRDISHELRSPLTRAQLAIALEQRQGGGQQLPRLQQELERLEQMLDELLTFSRLDAGQYLLQAQDLDLVDLVDEIIELNQLEADQKNQLISWQAPTALWIQADARLLGRAIENVLRNAIKYSPADSQIQVQLSINASQLELRIQDQGPGIPTSCLDAIFEPFYRVSASREQQTGGTGLGLAIAAQAVKLHQGQISAQLPTAGGLVILLQLPLQPTEN